MITEKLSIELLTNDSVTVKLQRFFVDGGKEYPIGKPESRGYYNSVIGRQEVEELPDAQKTAVFAIWGNEPTVDETVREAHVG